MGLWVFGPWVSNKSDFSEEEKEQEGGGGRRGAEEEGGDPTVDAIYIGAR